MTQNADIKQLTKRARLLLGEGRSEDIDLATLKTISTGDEQLQEEIAFLLGWYYIERKQWDEASNILSPVIEKLKDSSESQETPADRERLAYQLLRLGIATVNKNRYEDAAQHFSLCLKVLHDRRVHLPSVRIQARYSLGMTCIMRGLYPAAIQYYKEAIQLCQHYENEEQMAEISHGLCYVYRIVGDLPSAYSTGQKALKLYEQKKDRYSEARMHELLGLVCHRLHDFREASDHYTRSLTLASLLNTPTMIMHNCASLAELRLAEGLLEEARFYCELALDNLALVTNNLSRGMTYHMVANVTYKEAVQLQNMERFKLLEKAEEWYEKAIQELTQTQSYQELAETYGDWAHMLEDTQQEQKAIECWRKGYAILERQKEAQG